MIGPHFDRLAQEHSKPKKMAFAKIDTEQHNDISGSYGVRSLPTFKVFHKGACIDTVQGADPSALAAAINKAKNLVGSTTGEDMFKSSGRVLGGKGLAGNSARGRATAQRVSSRPSFNLSAFITGLFNFLGLYIVSLFAVGNLMPCFCPLRVTNSPLAGLVPRCRKVHVQCKLRTLKEY